MLSVAELIASKGVPIDGRVHKRTKQVVVENPDYVKVAEYVVSARELLTYIRLTVEAGGTLDLQAMNLERFCNSGLGYDPELMAIIGTTRKEVESYVDLQHIHHARVILTQVRSAMSDETGRNVFVGSIEKLCFYCRDYLRSDHKLLNQVGVTNTELDEMMQVAQFRYAKACLEACRDEQKTHKSPLGEMYYAGSTLRTLIKTHGISLEELGTTTQEVESFPSRPRRNYPKW